MKRTDLEQRWRCRRPFLQGTSVMAVPGQLGRLWPNVLVTARTSARPQGRVLQAPLLTSSSMGAKWGRLAERPPRWTCGLSFACLPIHVCFPWGACPMPLHTVALTLRVRVFPSAVEAHHTLSARCGQGLPPSVQRFWLDVLGVESGRSKDTWQGLPTSSMRRGCRGIPNSKVCSSKTCVACLRQTCSIQELGCALRVFGGDAELAEVVVGTWPWP